MKITGILETYLTDKNEVKRKLSVRKNTIDLTFYGALADYLNLHSDSGPNTRIVFSQLFTGGNGWTDSQEGRDGILARLYGGSLLEAAFATTITQPGSNKFRATGVWTNPTQTSITLTDAQLGVNWLKLPGWEYEGDGGRFHAFVLAKDGMSPTLVPVGDTLTIVWTITFTVH